MKKQKPHLCETTANLKTDSFTKMSAEECSKMPAFSNFTVSASKTSKGTKSQGQALETEQLLLIHLCLF